MAGDDDVEDPAHADDPAAPRRERDVVTAAMLTLRRRKYAEVEPDASGWRSSPLWRCAFRLRSIRNPAGLVEYRLDVREPTPRPRG